MLCLALLINWALTVDIVTRSKCIMTENGMATALLSDVKPYAATQNMSGITQLDTSCIIHMVHPTEFDVTDT